MKWTQQHIETVRYARFARLPSGYDEEAVDAYLASIVSCMRGGRQIPETVVPTAFASRTGGLGYEPEGVDSLLFVLHGWREQYAEASRRPVASRWVPPEPGQPIEPPPMHDVDADAQDAARPPEPSPAPTLTPALPSRRTEPAASAPAPAPEPAPGVVKPATRIGLTGRDELSVPPPLNPVESAPSSTPVVGASRLAPLKKASAVDGPRGFQKMASKLFSMPTVEHDLRGEDERPAPEARSAPAPRPAPEARQPEHTPAPPVPTVDATEPNRPLSVVPAPELPVADAVRTKPAEPDPAPAAPQPERATPARPPAATAASASAAEAATAKENLFESPAGQSTSTSTSTSTPAAAEPKPSTREAAPVTHLSDQGAGSVVWSQDQQDRIHDIGFPTARPASSGYAEKDVDNLLDEITEAMANGRPLPDIEAARFKRGSVVRAAYDADAVDDFLDEVLEMRPTKRAV